MHKAAAAALLVGMLLAVGLFSTAAPVAALRPIAQASEAAPTEAVSSPTEAPVLPTEAPNTPCIPGAAPTEAAPTAPATEGASESPAAAPATEGASESPAAAPATETVPCATEPAASEGPTSSEAASGFCALLTADEVGAITKHTMTVGTSDDSSCGWTSVSGDDVVILVIQDLAPSDFDDIKALALPGVTNTAVPGVGDDAFVQSLNDVTSSLYLKKGDKGIQVTLVDPAMAGSDVANEEIQLAQLLAGRI
jgi:hypothetical protein